MTPFGSASRIRMKDNSTDEKREKILADDIWLNYFNDYLYRNNAITEEEYKKMSLKIAQKNRNKPLM